MLNFCFGWYYVILKYIRCLKQLLKFDLGEIGRQTIKGSGYSYIGVLIGFLTTAVLFPRLLSTEQIGVTTLLVTYSQFISIVGNFGFGGAITRLFPYFKNANNGHNGIVFLILLVLFVGYLFSALAYYALYPYIVSQDISNELFFKFSWLVFPLSFFILAYNLFDTYARAIGNAVTGVFVKEIVQRVVVLLAIVMFALSPIVSFEYFLWLYVFAFFISGILILLYLISKKQFSIQPKFEFLRPGFRKIIYNVSFYSILQGFGNILVQRVDTVMISFYLSLQETGIYGTTFFFGLLITLPSRSLSRITSTVMAHALKDKDHKRVLSIYKKSSINQLLAGALVFVGIWGNIDSVFVILTEEFRIGEYVIFFIGLSNVINSSIGANAQIIQLSKYYRYTAYLLLVFVALVVISNFVFIPQFGIVGAALASCISVFIYSLIRLWLVYDKFDMHPFSSSHLKVVIISAAALFSSSLLPSLDFFVFDILIRSTLISTVFIGLSIYFKVSEDLNALFAQFKQKLNI